MILIEVYVVVALIIVLAVASYFYLKTKDKKLSKIFKKVIDLIESVLGYV